MTAHLGSTSKLTTKPPKYPREPILLAAVTARSELSLRRPFSLKGTLAQIFRCHIKARHR